MYEFLEYTAGKMTPITPYGLFHIAFFVIGLALSIYLAYKLKNIDKKKLNKIIFGIGLFLLITEIYKQLFYTFYIGGGTYQWWIFPFQLCSIPLYICLILPFIKNKKVYNGLCVFLISYNLLGGFISFFEPSGLIHEYISLTAHAFLWHMSLVFLGILLGLNKNVIKTKKEFNTSIWIYIILCITAFIINLLLWKVASGDINMFFVGPKTSSIYIFKTIAAKFGWFVNDIIFMPVMTLGSYLIYLPFTTKKLTKL